MVDGELVDVRVAQGVVDAIGRRLPTTGVDEVIDGRRRPLIPGLHDHHIHLMATAAATRSVPVGPADVADAAGLAGALRSAMDHAGPGGWVRATGYHDSVAGPLDRWTLDAMVGDHPVRVQHRSGAMWVLSSAACREVELGDAAPAGAELDGDAQPTGRLFRLDGWLRDRLPPAPVPDLPALAGRLNRLGVTGVTDASPIESTHDLAALVPATGTLHVQATGGPALTQAAFPDGLIRGPVKVVLDDHDLPALDDLVKWFDQAHRNQRAVAVHCVTRLSLVLALAAWDEAGARVGDRVEHGSVIPPALFARLADLGLIVVTQPGFVAERGDQYLADVDPADIGDLYRCRTLLEAGVAVVGSTDAPCSSPDPWAAMRAAADRQTPSGRVLGSAERVGTEQALGLFLAPLTDPGGPRRRVAAGCPADLALLSAPPTEVLAKPTMPPVALTLVDGQIAWRAED